MAICTQVAGSPSLLTEYGCYIRTRLGLHEAASDDCSNKGLILLELIDDAGGAADELEKRLLEIGDVIVKKMVF